MYPFDAKTIHAVSHFFFKIKLKYIGYIFSFLNYLLHNSWIPPMCEIGEDTKFGKWGIGVVIHERSKIGKHCLIGQGITIGGKSGVYDVPIIMDNVFIGPGARIIGDIKIGHDSIIGANAVVVKDVKPFSVITGIPGKCVDYINKDNYDKKYKYYYGPKIYRKNGD